MFTQQQATHKAHHLLTMMLKSVFMKMKIKTKPSNTTMNSYASRTKQNYKKKKKHKQSGRRRRQFSFFAILTTIPLLALVLFANTLPLCVFTHFHAYCYVGYAHASNTCCSHSLCMTITNKCQKLWWFRFKA